MLVRHSCKLSTERGERFTGIDVRLNPSPLISPNPRMSASGATHAFQPKSALVFLPPVHSADLAGVDIEGFGHCLVHQMDWKFVGDEAVQRIGGLACVQEAQAARVAGRGDGYSAEVDWFASRWLCGRLSGRSRKCE